MDAIKTKYYGPTNYKGARIIARAPGGFYQHKVRSVIKPYDYALGHVENHQQAANELFSRLDIRHKTIIGGSMGDCMVWIIYPGAAKFNVKKESNACAK